MFVCRSLDLDRVVVSQNVEQKSDSKEDVDLSSPGGVTWDEPTIAEHDKERGTRMKINEPNTPYNADKGTFSSDDETSSMDIDSSPRGSQKLSPRFATPPSPKRQSLGADAVAENLHSTAEEPLNPGQRKIRTSAEPVSSSLDHEALQRRMEQVKEERTHDDARTIHQVGEADDEEETDFMTPQDRAKKAAFSEKRKQHYNEFKRMKELLGGQGDEEDDSSSSSDSN